MRARSGARRPSERPRKSAPAAVRRVVARQSKRLRFGVEFVKSCRQSVAGIGPIFSGSSRPPPRSALGSPRGGPWRPAVPRPSARLPRGPRATRQDGRPELARRPLGRFGWVRPRRHRRPNVDANLWNSKSCGTNQLASFVVLLPRKWCLAPSGGGRCEVPARLAVEVERGVSIEGRPAASGRCGRDAGPPEIHLLAEMPKMRGRNPPISGRSAVEAFGFHDSGFPTPLVQRPVSSRIARPMASAMISRPCWLKWQQSSM